MQKPKALAISLGLHVTTFFALMYAPPISLPSLPEKSPSEYQQAFAGKEDKIVWYKFKELPDVRPPDSAKARRPLRAEVQQKQSVISSPKNAPKRLQVVVTPAPAIDLPPLDLPNLIAVKLPPKQFTTPPDLVRPEALKIELPDAPQMETPQLEAAKLPSERLPAKVYIPPPPTKPVLTAKLEAPTEIPKLETQSMSKPSLPSSRLPARAYVPPPASPGAPGPKSVTAPQIIDGPAGDITIAIAGLNPTTTAVKLPAASSPAQFSAGEKVRPNGATSDGANTGIVAPDLYAHTEGAKKPDLLALSAPPPGSQQFIDDMLRRQSPGVSRPATAPGATRVSNAPDPRFNGREVYMMAIQMPNLTSYSGSWLMWYSPRTMDETALAGLTAPTPYIKVDPKYTQSAQADHMEGRVLLSCVIGRQGHVTSIELVRGVNDQLNRSAEEALSKMGNLLPGDAQWKGSRRRCGG